MNPSSPDQPAPGLVHPVNLEFFEAIMETHSMVILDFWAEWCKPCKIFAPAFQIMAELHPEIFFGSVNTEVTTDLAEAFQIRSIPTLIAFKKGEIIFEQSGLLPADQFERLINHLKT